MSRIALIDFHDTVETVVRYGDDATDLRIFEHAMSTYKSHRIKRITICQANVVFENSTTLEIAIETARKLIS